ncbi:S9 family peptidase [Actinophytocola sp. KF-1]
MTPTDLLLDQYVATRHLRLGVPRGIVVSPDGARVLFVRSRGGRDPLSCLWEHDVADGTERVVVDPTSIPTADGGAPSAAELFMRERRRQRTEGITAFATDDAVELAAFTLSGRLLTVDLRAGADRTVRVCGPAGAAFDPRPSPDGRHIAYVDDGALRVVGADGTHDRALAPPEHDEVRYGVAELAAAEDMKRTRGFWWSPRGDGLLVARVDESVVPHWHLPDPLDPRRPPRVVAYPAAGTTNPDVSLWLFGLDGSRTRVDWDGTEFEYLVAVTWTSERPLLAVQDRSQRSLRVLRADPATGACAVLRTDTDPLWVTPVPGVPLSTSDDELVWVSDRDGTSRLLVDDSAVSPVGPQVREVYGVDGDRVLFGASGEPSEIQVWEWSRRTGARRVTTEPGVWTCQSRGGTDVLSGRILGRGGFRIDVRRAGRPAREIGWAGEAPVIPPNVTLLTVGDRAVRTAVVLPAGHRPDGPKLPVLVDSYGGPDAQRVLAALDRYVLPQWFAEQGFAVVVADGRGSPGRGPGWSHEVAGDFATPALQDQVDALRGAAEVMSCLDLDRVAIRGWSFAGYLATLAVLRRPDVFHAAAAGGALTDARLYASYWMERYLGHPDTDPRNYDRCSLIDEAHVLSRPLLLMHGLRDDNVFAAHLYRLSGALLAAHRPHTVVALPTSSHFVTEAEIEKQVARLQVEFLTDALRTRTQTPAAAGLAR